MKRVKKEGIRCIAFPLLLLLFISISSHFLSIKVPILIYNKSGNQNEIRDPDMSIKYDWNKTIIKGGDDLGRSIVLDTNGNVYVTGKTYNLSKNAFDVYIGMYNTSGAQIWNTTWGGNMDDAAYSIAIDSLNNIYITGYTISYSNGNADIIIIQYNNLGILQWNKTWGGTEFECGYDIIIDDFNNILIVGYTEKNDVFGDVILLKYNTSGYLKWEQYWGGSDTDLAYHIGLDLDENIYITGYTSSFGAETSDLFLVKFNSSFELQWNITWGGDLPDDGYSLTIDSSNDILVVGNTQNYGAGGNDLTLLKINSYGELIWNTTWGGSEHEFAYSIDLDSKENIYVTGYTKSYDGIDEDVYVVKFNSSGDFIWYKIWGNTFDDRAYDITIDPYDNIFITGQTENLEDNKDIFLLKYLPLPDNFELTAYTISPDPDGNFTLSWIASLDANNYSLYQSNETIIEIDENVVELVKETTNLTYSLMNLEEGTYYYMALSFNEYGNTSSNCVKVIVQYPPDEFILYNNTEIPDTDGKINLTWSISTGAKNYSIFVYDHFFYDVKVNGTLIAQGINSTFLLVENLTNGDYYYIVVAFNEAGQTLSNCIQVIVRRAPTPFTLTSDAGKPDDDGTFELIWTKSEFAMNYTIFVSNYSITIINDSIQELYNFTPSFDWPTYRYKITNWENGTYYFIIVAYNRYGNSYTNCIEVVVKIPKEINNNPTSNKDIMGFVTRLILYITPFGLAGALAFLYLRKRKVKYFKKYNKK